MEDKKSYQKRMEEQIRQLADKIDELLKKTEKRIREEYHLKVENLPEKLEKAQKKLRELKRAGEEAWEKEAKPALERALGELKETFERVSAKFKGR